jgi:DNA-binding transcriptional MerR regulator
MLVMSTMFSAGKAADYLGVGVKTLQRWDREGRLKPERTSTGRRIYSKAARDAFLRRSPSSFATRMPIACCRVSSAAQRPDLKGQRRLLEDFCAARGVTNAEFAEEVGGGEIRRQLQYKAAMRGGRIMIADRFYPSTQFCSCRGRLTGPKGREDMHVEHWICSECGADHERDANAAINLRRLGLAEAELTCRDMVPLPAFFKSTASTVVVNLTARTCAHI